MKGLIILANGFEDSEAIITIDLLRRAKINLDLISLTNDKVVLTSSNIYISADFNYLDININDYDFLIIPGGKAVFNYHLQSDLTKNIVEHFMNKKALVACICAAPMILGRLGYLKDLEFTCFPTCEEDYFGGIYLPEKEVVVSKNIITSKAMGTTFSFGYEIIKYLLNEETADKIIKSVYYKDKTFEK